MEELSTTEIVVIIILIIFFGIVAVSFFVGLLYIQMEHFFVKIFKRPIYIHFYLFPKRLETIHEHLLRQHSPFYMKLSPKQKRYFEHRVQQFISRYEFVGREDFVITDEVRIRIATTYVMMTFGMRNYLTPVIERIIVYPSAYRSTLTDDLHKGEFNPRAKVVVFSWEDFVAGDQHRKDNVNLGIHEFAHVIHAHGRTGTDVSAGIFADRYNEILQKLSNPVYRDSLLESDYFRDYGATNHFEFLAVLLEHYFETPAEMRTKFPDLYRKVGRMLNHRHRITPA